MSSPAAQENRFKIKQCQTQFHSNLLGADNSALTLVMRQGKSEIDK